MAKNARVERGMVDDLQDAVVILASMLEKIKKEPLDRRTTNKYDYYHEQRQALWEKIQHYDNTIRAESPPDEYYKKFDEAIKVNEEIITRLQTWKPKTLAITTGAIKKTTTSENTSNEEDDHQGAAAISAGEESGDLKNTENYSNIMSSLNQFKSDNEKLTQLITMLTEYQISASRNKTIHSTEIEKFSGQIEEYPNWKNSMLRIIRERYLEDESALIYLKSKLQGLALETIQHLQILPGNYLHAWGQLDQCYDNPRQVLLNALSLIYDDRCTTRSRDAESYIRFIGMYSTVRSNVQILKASIDDVLMFMILSRMDDDTRGRFEDACSTSAQTPSFDQLTTFLNKEKLVCLNRPSVFSVGNPQTILNNNNKKSTHPKQSRTLLTSNSTSYKCFICSKEHLVLNCDVFKSSPDKIALLKSHRICVRCGKHRYREGSKCRSHIKCDFCPSTEVHNHITALHPTITIKKESKTFVTNDNLSLGSLLPTAILRLVDSKNITYPIRGLIDLCAETSYVSEFLVQKLSLQKYKADLSISGIGNILEKSSAYVFLHLKIDENPENDIRFKAYVVPKVVGRLPSVKIDTKRFRNLNIPLADPNFYRSSFVGVLIGSDVAPNLFQHGIPNKVTDDGLILQPTKLGWIIAGGVQSTNSIVSTFVTTNESAIKGEEDPELIQRLLEFFNLPEVMDNIDEANICEQMYTQKTYRLKNGKYVVPIFRKPDAPTLGTSYISSCRFFFGQEKRWLKNPTHYKNSNDFMRKYEELGHMSEVTDKSSNLGDHLAHYIPYISILKPDSLTTPIRNVFHASMKTSNGFSLNDCLFEGPKLQTRIPDILLTSRTFKMIYSADISMMFRQILIRPEDRDVQRIIWRSNPNEPLRVFRLNTVTYGTDSAPFLAIRTLHQCATDNAPNAKIDHIIKNSFYMDDLLYGGDSTEECISQINQINDTLSAGCFHLTKWMTNYPELLENLPKNSHLASYLPPDHSITKLLGVNFDFISDEFQIKLKELGEITYTKRGVSSKAASFYDPLGFLLPFIMMLRILLKNVWKTKIGWDEYIGDELKDSMTRILTDIHKLNYIRIPRWISYDTNETLQFVGFADASAAAHAAVVYSRFKVNDKYKTVLVVAKGNVTKLKTTEVVASKQQTIPKLELQALLTLTELFSQLKKVSSHKTIEFIAYTDSQVVLSWIRNSDSIKNKYVSKKVNLIKEIIKSDQLYYVRSEENPADAASRGQTAEKLANNSLWLNGPSWLVNEVLPTTSLELKTPISTVLTLVNDPETDMFEKYSKWEKVLRIVCYCLSWKSKNHNGFTSTDITTAKLRIILYYQNLYLLNCLEPLRAGKLVPRSHWLYKLSPFIDDNGLLRVGGRLNNAKHISASQRNPIVIPKGHLCKLLIDYMHRTTGHSGLTLMIRSLINEYWIPGLKGSIKIHISKCVKCIRWAGRNIQPEMSNLPIERITPSETFSKVGVDLSGPFSMKASPLKFDRKLKVWVVHFVCLVTKAVHLELITSLSTENFIAALSRFCSRRGCCNEIWSDNGTNFVGTNRMIKESWEKIVREAELATALQEISWKFIPRHSPTFGGLWEASVKSMKYFMKRMSDVTNLTYEEFDTLLCRIEALLNSRPLYKNPIDADSEPAITPFHFINQRGFKASALDVDPKVPLTKKWLMIKQIQQDVWERFHSEYLLDLQSKNKWIKPQPNMETKDIVLIKEPSIIQGDWKMGIVTKTYPDPHGVVRKVDVKDANREVKVHAVNKLVPLLKSESLMMAPDRPALRRSERTKTKVSLVHLCLLVLITCFPSSSSSLESNQPRITPLSSGIHVENLGEYYHRIYDLEFHFDPKINLTYDLQFFDISINNFAKDCENHKKVSETIAKHCEVLMKELKLSAQYSKATILKEYNTKKRQRRGLSTFEMTPVYRTLSQSSITSTTSLNKGIYSKLSKVAKIPYLSKLAAPAVLVATVGVSLKMKGKTPNENNKLISIPDTKALNTLVTKLESPAGPAKLRNKRRVIGKIIGVVKPAAKFAVKNADTIALAMMLSHSQDQITEMKAELQESRMIMAKTLNYLADQKDYVQDNTQKVLLQLEYERQEQLILNTVMDFAQQLKIVYDNYVSKHTNLKYKKPLAELQEYVTKLKLNSPSINLPDIGEKIFDYGLPELAINDGGLISLSYSVPIVQKETLTAVGIISVPNSKGKIFKLTNGHYFQTLVLSKDNKSYVDISNLNFNNNIINIKLNFLPINNCIKTILDKDHAEMSCEEVIEPCTSVEWIYRLNDSKSFFLNSCSNSTRLNCGTSSILINFMAAIVEPQNCSITNSHQKQKRPSTSRLKRGINDLKEYGIEPLYIETRISKLQPATNTNHSTLMSSNDLRDLAKLLEKPHTKSWFWPSLGTLIAIVVAIIIIRILWQQIKGLFIRSNARTDQPERWFVHWKGPASIELIEARAS